MGINLDANLENADWTKGTWDLPFQDVESLRTYLAAVGDTVEKFKKRPIYTRNVDKMPWLKDL
jgi:hypothetical protein